MHPWNHAPADLPAAHLQALRGRYERSLRSRHACIVDALSGRRLDVREQCVPIGLAGGESAEHGLADAADVAGLAS